MLIHFRVNGKEVAVETEPLRRLLDVLREDLELKGTKEGCGEGECGACAVSLDGRLVNSCLVPVGAVDGCEIVTIEGFRDTPRHAALSEAFGAAGAVQCGFCTPGMMLAADAILAANPQASRDEIREGLSGNLCRCTGYNMIVEAIAAAARKGEGLW
jgi:aerobic carbon-monoxide dehydrogenase small subunit